MGAVMEKLKLLPLAILALLKQVRRLPERLAIARKQRRRRNVLAQGEVERLDRIRNPSKYRGK
jgi:hypothetical protein